MRATWSAEKLRDFREWHDRRMAELNYPPEIVQQLTDARERWLPAQTPVTFGEIDSHTEFDTSDQSSLNESPFFSRHSPSWVSKTPSGE